VRRSFTHTRLALATAAAVTLVACGRDEPRPIAYDEASCTYCHMGITDRRFGAELVTEKGKVHTFDSIECLASYYLKHRGAARSMWVTDFPRPGTLIRADSAHYVRGGEAQSPMGLGLVAYGESAAAARATARGGEAIGWGDVLALVERTRDDPHATHDASGGIDASR
jgi:copper chaperone NosL